MKTILDAVNTLKGVWPSESIQIIEIDGVEFSEKEFIICVAGCINNFGLPSVTAKDVYWDGREDLKVGMIALVNGSKKVILLTADNDGDYVTMNDDGNYDFDRIHYIKPIDNRTPIKLEDGCAYQFELNCSTYVGLYGDGRHAFFTNMPVGNKICGVIKAKNIIKLISKAES